MDRVISFRSMFVEHLEMGKTRDQAAWDAKSEYDLKVPEGNRSYWIDSDKPLPWELKVSEEMPIGS